MKFFTSRSRDRLQKEATGSIAPQREQQQADDIEGKGPLEKKILILERGDNFWKKNSYQVLRFLFLKLQNAPHSYNMANGCSRCRCNDG